MHHRRLSIFQTTPPAIPRFSTIARRVHGFTWQAFPIAVGTGAVYIALSTLHTHPPWLTKVEIGFFILNCILFIINCCTLMLQFILYRRQSRRLFFNNATGIFVPLGVLSLATILIGLINYAVPSGHITVAFVYDMFWLYTVLAVLISLPVLMIWFNNKHDIKTFSPAWAFPVFPLMLVGVVASNVLRDLPHDDDRALGVLLTGYIFQGLGFFITLFYLCLYILRIMTTGFMEGHQANGSFVACGPPGFTALALMQLGKASRLILPHHSLVTPMAGEIWYASSVLGALLLFGLSVFFFVFGIIPWWFKLHKNLSEILGCWALTFPNVGFILCIRLFGDIFHVQGLYIVHSIFVGFICLTWLVLFVLTGVAYYRGAILCADDMTVWQDSVLGISPSSSQATNADDSENGGAESRKEADLTEPSSQTRVSQKIV